MSRSKCLDQGKRECKIQNSITRAKQNRLFRCYRKLSYHLKQATLHAWLLLCILCGGLSMPLRFWLEPVRAASLLRKPKTIMPGLLFFLPVCFPSARLVFCSSRACFSGIRGVGWLRGFQKDVFRVNLTRKSFQKLNGVA
jgi:hypothetical protein